MLYPASYAVAKRSSQMTCEIVPVSTKADWHDFLSLPGLIYQKSELEKLLPWEAINRKFRLSSNPFLAHIEWTAFLAREKGQTLGRIVASVDHLCPEPTWGFFGFFECVEDQKIAGRLLQVAGEWLAGRRRLTAFGPISLSTSDNLGCLIEGFEQPNPFYLPYNPPYYAKLICQAGWESSHDLYAYAWEDSQKLSERLLRISKRLQGSGKVKIRPLNYRKLAAEARFFFHIYNQAMKNNWGHIPLTEKEAYFILASHRRLIPPEYFLWAEVEGRPAGLLMAQPNFRQNSLRLILLAVKPSYQHLGLSALLITRLLNIARQDGISGAELSFVQEGNTIVNRLISHDTKSQIIKRYRLFRKDLT